MEDSPEVAVSSSSDVASSNASANPIIQETIPYQLTSNQVETYPSNSETIVDAAGENTMPLQDLKIALRRQLEYYFSRENLSTDEYLQSQMDGDNFVAISTVAKFRQVRRLTDDFNLIVEVLRESAVVQVDEAGEKVRPNPRSGVLILREIPESTPIAELEELFNGETCPKFLRCEFAHNNSWYVLFETDEDTQKAYQYLREEAKQFRGKPVMARIKAKAITSAPFTPSYKNGNTVFEPESYNGQNVSHPPQQQQPTLQYTYANIPSENYNSQQVCPPFYPPTMLQAWAPSTPACVDLGTVLSVNGLSPQAAYRPALSNNSNRHNYATRDSEQNRYYSRGQPAYLQRQQLQQQAASFSNIVNAGNCAAYDFRAYPGRNIGYGMEFFTTPSIYYNKSGLQYLGPGTQVRHNQVVLPRNQVGVGAINCQDQSYVPVQNSNATYSKESAGVSAGAAKQGVDPQVKENWAPNQRQPRNKRWWKESGSNRNYSDHSNNSNYSKSLGETDTKPESPKFDLETTSFPPLPGSENDIIVDVDVYESRLSDIVKGTVKPTTRDTKTQTSESALVSTATKDSSTITSVDAVIPSDGAFTPPSSPENLNATVSTTEPVKTVENCQETDDWEDLADSPAEEIQFDATTDSANVVPEAATAATNNASNHHQTSTNSLVNGSATMVDSSTSTSAVMPETEPTANVPSDAVEAKQTASAKLSKAKQLDTLPKSSRSQCDLPSPKNKTVDASSIKNKFDAFKDRTAAPKQLRTPFSNSKNSESSFNNKDRCDHAPTVPNKSAEPPHNTSKGSSDYKDKLVQSHTKTTNSKVPDSNPTRAKVAEPETALLSVNGHADSESTVSSEDEKPFRKLTYSEVAMRAKEKVEKIAQDMKEKERQEAIVRQHRPQDNLPQSRQAPTSGPLRDFPRGRVPEARPGPKEWRERERRKPARAISLPATGQ